MLGLAKTWENEPVSRDDLLDRGECLFDHYYTTIRTMLQYGLKVKEWLIDSCQIPLYREPSARLNFKSLVQQIGIFMPEELQ